MTSIAIIGSGMIGQSWAICFARAGFEVRLFDHVAGGAQSGQAAVQATLSMLARSNLLQGQTSDAVLARIRCAATLSEAVAGVVHVQEDREAAVHALMIDPLTSAVCELQQIRDMFDEMVAAQHEHLPSYLH